MDDTQMGLMMVVLVLAALGLAAILLVTVTGVLRRLYVALMGDAMTPSAPGEPLGVVLVLGTLALALAWAWT